jgi:hypothetical protein
MRTLLPCCVLLKFRYAVGNTPCSGRRSTREGYGNHCTSVEVTMTRNGLVSMLVEIAVGAAIFFAVLFAVFAMVRVAGSMQLDGIFSWI